MAFGFVDESAHCGAVRRPAHDAGRHRAPARAGQIAARGILLKNRPFAHPGPHVPTYQIAVIAGDGIGREVMPEGLRAVQAAAQRFGLPLAFHPSTGPTATTTCSTEK